MWVMDTDHALKKKPLLDAYLEVYEGLCSEKKVFDESTHIWFLTIWEPFMTSHMLEFQVDLTGEVLIGRSVRKTLVREAKSCAAAAVIVGISKRRALR